MMTRALAVLLLAMVGAGLVVPTHRLDAMMLMGDGFLWGSAVDVNFSNRPLLDASWLLQPPLVLATALGCGWTLRTGHPRSLLAAVGLFQLLLVATGLHSYAIDGGSWRGRFTTTFFDVLQGGAGALLLVCVALERRRRRTDGAAPRSPADG